MTDENRRANKEKYRRMMKRHHRVGVAAARLMPSRAGTRM